MRAKISRMDYELVVGLEVHAELLTRSKMFCACPVLDNTESLPNRAVCPVCEGLPGALPVINAHAVELAMRVALALNCRVHNTSIFARKNYFYPDLPKGYQVSQFEDPLATDGELKVSTAQGEKVIRVRRAHLEEDTGKLTHLTDDEGNACTLIDLNRAGVPLLEIVTEPDMRSVEEVKAYAAALRAILREVGACSGDMEKGAMRLEANISLRPAGSAEYGTRVEVKNLNSFRAMERAIEFEVQRQAAILDQGGTIDQETLGWNEDGEYTYTQRSKEDAHDYRYFPEPDLPPLFVSDAWIAQVKASLPELPAERQARFAQQYTLSPADALNLSQDLDRAAYFEKAVSAADKLGVTAKVMSNWMLGEIFAWLNARAESPTDLKVAPQALVELASLAEKGEINLTTAKAVLTEMLETGSSAGEIVKAKGLTQVSDTGVIAALVSMVIDANPKELASFLAGKETLTNWFFGQVMREAKGQANPQVLRTELEKQLKERKISA